MCNINVNIYIYKSQYLESKVYFEIFRGTQNVL